jgi:hypothetical protein
MAREVSFKSAMTVSDVHLPVRPTASAPESQESDFCPNDESSRLHQVRFP